MRGARWLLAATLAVSFILSASFAGAAPDTAERTYLIGTGFICGLDPDACPAIARADNGDTVAIAGEGTLTPHPKSVTGGGTFVHKDSAGNVIGSGNWNALALISFKSYGTSPPFPPTFEGGLAILQIHLSSSTGLESDAVLQVDCLVGNPPAGAKEGVRLVVQAFDLNFNKEVSGFTLFFIP